MPARQRRRGTFAQGLALAAVAATSLTGCFDDPTEVVVVVDTDAIPSQDFVQIQFNVSQNGVSFADAKSLPATLGLTRGGPSPEFDVTVTLNTVFGFGQRGELPFVTRKVSHVRFVQDHMKVLFLPLFRACACVAGAGSAPSTNCAHALDPECHDITEPVLGDFDEGNIPHLP